jgi:uncharacterized integral membrane protein (TIGR00698 family)
MSRFLRPLFFLAAIFVMVWPQASGPFALALGASFSLLLGNPFLRETKQWTPRLLQASIVGLGASMDLNAIARVGAQGFLYTVVGIAFTLALSFAIGKLLKTEAEVTALLGVGTAICGGSAIAAVSPVIRAQDRSVSVALASVFILNAVALLLFPVLGHWALMDQRQFGLFSALAIHDTSSVVGSAMQYGHEALTVATTVKLVRALWIIPITLSFAFFWKARAQEGAKNKPVKKPWFILGFLVTAALATWFPTLSEPFQWVTFLAKRGMVLCLFLIGAGLTRETLLGVGFRPFIHGILLWITVIAATWAAIETGWVS